MIRFHRLTSHILLSVVFIFLTTNVLAQDLEKGEKLFKQNCTACHMMSEAKLVGPGLKGVTEKYEKEWLVKWITNSQEFIASGDERAIKIFEEYNKSVMQSFDFSEDELNDLIGYLANPPQPKQVAVNSEGVEEGAGMNTSTQLMIIALVLVTLVFLLVSLKNSLKTALGQETETVPTPAGTKGKLPMV